MVIIFILLVFTAGQFYLSAALSGRDEALHKLQQQIDQLADLLSLERHSNADFAAWCDASSTAQLKSAQAERDRLTCAGSRSSPPQAKEAATQGPSRRRGSCRRKADQRRRALTQVDRLNAQIAALREQLSAIAAALDISEAKVKTQQDQIVDLGQKLNLALANKVEELARYRSEFFGRLREILGNRPDIRIVGDRFVFQSEVLFAPGSADLSDAAKKELDPVIAALKQIAAKIPPDIDWILLVNGHTDHRPIARRSFRRIGSCRRRARCRSCAMPSVRASPRTG